jgi:pyrrolidone-carboxylate peptidase
VQPLVVVTGFGAFEHVQRNASGEVARLLEREPPAGVRVRAAELPVAFADVPLALARHLSALSPSVPDLLLGLGVQKLASFRLERRARGRLAGERPDNRGRSASASQRGRGVDRTTPFALAELARALQEAGAPRVEVSEDAGSYVCERAYYELLEAGRRLGRPALFLHVPPADAVPPERQAPIVRALVSACLRS